MTDAPMLSQGSETTGNEPEISGARTTCYRCHISMQPVVLRYHVSEMTGCRCDQCGLSYLFNPLLGGGHSFHMLLHQVGKWVKMESLSGRKLFLPPEVAAISQPRPEPGQS